MGEGTPRTNLASPMPSNGRSRRMTTVADLSEQELAELKELTNQTDAAATIRAATAEYVRYVRRMHLKELSGRLTMEENGGQLARRDPLVGGSAIRWQEDVR